MQAADCLYLITVTLFYPVYIHLCSVTIPLCSGITNAPHIARKTVLHAATMPAFSEPTTSLCGTYTSCQCYWLASLHN